MPEQKSDLAKLALAGLLGGSLAFGAVAIPGCSSGGDKEAPAATSQPQFTELHECAGQNTCKGLGGCSVDAAKLEMLSKKMGIDPAQAGEPHSCAGLNECKGLGGCSVDAERLATLKARLKK